MWLVAAGAAVVDAPSLFTAMSALLRNSEPLPLRVRSGLPKTQNRLAMSALDTSSVVVDFSGTGITLRLNVSRIVRTFVYHW